MAAVGAVAASAAWAGYAQAGWLAGAASGLAGAVGLGGALVIDRRVQQSDAAAAARDARAEVLLPLFAALPGAAGGTAAGRPYRGSLVALLRADRAVVRFWGRRSELAHLDAWRDDAAGGPVLLITGPAGSGKTRLALHWAAGLPAPWCAGRLATGRGPDAVARIRAAGQPAVVVVDDADVRADLGPFLEQLAAQRGGPTVRALLVARDEGGLRTVLRRAPAGPARGFAKDAGAVPLAPLGGIDDRRRWFDAAARAFADVLATPAPPGQGYALAAATANEPILTVYARALAAVLAGTGRTVGHVGRAPLDRVFRDLVESEAGWWADRAADPRWAVQGFSDEQRARAVVALVLRAPASLDDAVAVLRRIAELREETDGLPR